MKKLLLAIFFMVLFAGITVNAQEDVYEDTVRYAAVENRLPETYVDSGISLSAIDEFEKRIKAGWDNFSAEIDVKDLIIPTSFIEDKYFRIAFDSENTLKYYYVSDSFGYSYYEDCGTVVSIFPKYTETNIEVVSKTILDVKEETEKILMHIRDDMNDFEKVMTVHDYMVLNYQYDMTGQINDIRIITTKTGMCMSYAFAFDYIMDVLGIDCVFVSSEAMNHAWNLVKIDGKWYHIDLTWDDPTTDHFAHVHHTFALASSFDFYYNKSGSHYGFDLNGLVADSSLYDNAPWKKGSSAIVFVAGNEYWISENKLVSSTGKVIYSNIKTAEKWPINSEYNFDDPNAIYSGLAVYDDVLYFNTDNAIMSYDVYSEEIKIVKKEKYVCGLYIEGGILKYSKGKLYKVFDSDKGEDVFICNFEYAGEIKLGEFDSKVEVADDGKIKVDFYKEKEGKVKVFAFGKGKSNGKVKSAVKDIVGKGHVSTSFDSDDEEITLFFWDENLRPLKPKQVVKVKK